MVDVHLGPGQHHRRPPEQRLQPGWDQPDDIENHYSTRIGMRVQATHPPGRYSNHQWNGGGALNPSLSLQRKERNGRG